MLFKSLEPVIPNPDKYKLLQELIREEMKRNIAEGNDYDAEKDVLLAELLEEAKEMRVKEIYKDLSRGVRNEIT